MEPLVCILVPVGWSKNISLGSKWLAVTEAWYMHGDGQKDYLSKLGQVYNRQFLINIQNITNIKKLVYRTYQQILKHKSYLKCRHTY